MVSASMHWQIAAYECYRLAEQGETDAAQAKWHSLNDEIGQTLSAAGPGSLPGLLKDLERFVADVGGWNSSGQGPRWVFKFHHALLD